jgi:transposase
LILNKSVLFQVESKVPNPLLIFQSSSKSGDYHDDMNHMIYKKWLQEKLIPNLESKSVIVADNAFYHNVQLNQYPTSNASKGEILSWLDKRGIRYSSNMTKAELYDLIKMHIQQCETFEIDCLLAEHGHMVIRLPPYHPDLNPIETIWGIVKTRIAAKNVTFKL